MTDQELAEIGYKAYFDEKFGPGDWGDWESNNSTFKASWLAAAKAIRTQVEADTRAQVLREAAEICHRRGHILSFQSSSAARERSAEAEDCSLAVLSAIPTPNHRGENTGAQNSGCEECHSCDECSGDGWVYNRVEGRGACTCMVEAEPFQIIFDALEEIRKAATGEIQIAEDDTEGMQWIGKEALKALSAVWPLDYDATARGENTEAKEDV